MWRVRRNTVKIAAILQVFLLPGPAPAKTAILRQHGFYSKARLLIELFGMRCDEAPCLSGGGGGGEKVGRRGIVAVRAD